MIKYHSLWDGSGFAFSLPNLSLTQKKKTREGGERQDPHKPHDMYLQSQILSQHFLFLFFLKKKKEEKKLTKKKNPSKSFMCRGIFLSDRSSISLFLALDWKSGEGVSGSIHYIRVFVLQESESGLAYIHIDGWELGIYVICTWVGSDWCAFI